jgi:lipopolysaccharide transport system ATP-binding protein
MQGEPEAVMDYYNALIAEKESGTVRQQATEQGRTQTESGTGEASIEGVRVLDAQREPLEVVAVGQAVILEVQVAIHHDIERLVAGFMIKDRLGLPVFGTNTHHLKQPEAALRAGEKLTYEFRFDAELGQGSYSVSIALHELQTHMSRNYQWRDHALVFEVINMGVPEFIGTSYMPVAVSVARRAEALQPQASEA